MSSPESSRAEGTKDARFSPPVVSLPKGGGAIKGIGEKFAANLVTGTGSLSIPLPLSPGRSGFTPALTLGYDSGVGNGPYGFGWSVGCPAITRRTDRGLPRYLAGEESDVFILSGAEDLVPVLRSDGSRLREERDGYRIDSYRPRVEGLFARIERWTSLTDPSDSYWRSISRDNVTTFYGKTAASRIADATDPTRTFTWLLCESFDDKGNATIHEYAPEDGRNVNLALASEANRTVASRSVNRYLKRVKYGNRTSRLIEPDLSAAEWLFELVMDYGDHEGDAPGATPTRSWPVRPDPFSTCRAGFEVRTYRRCRRVLMFHRFAELGPEPKLVRSLELDYDDFAYPSGFDPRSELEHPGSGRAGSFLRRATVFGYAADQGVRRSMPPIEFGYARPHVSEEVRTLEEGSYANLPAGVDGVQAQWLDLNSEGLSGVLGTQPGAWWYKPNLGDGHLGPQQLVAQQPSIGLEGRGQFLDLDGNGLLDLVQLSRPNAGYFEHDDDDGWSPFVPFPNQPNVDWNDPNLRLVDLTGDGQADILITEDDALCWHPSLGDDGFGPRQSVRTVSDEARGPRVLSQGAGEAIFLADMSGDGLSDLVRIRNAEICYWPNLGYGRFGAKVTMDDAPVLDAPDRFDSRRLRLADIDGSGVVDVIYLGGDAVRLYFNRAGNGWTAAHPLAHFPPVDHGASISVTDLLGNGTACLVWSSPLPNDARAPLQFVDLMGGQKPHLLVGVENNLGARTVIRYAASTRFYLQDQRAGRPWITRLPFPVHVVERLESHDDISHNRFVSRYTYHHGYFDGVEREFRGFGMVEQLDTEEFAALDADQQLSPASNVDASSHVPPVLTRTWFHTGVFFGRGRVSRLFAGLLDGVDPGEYYREPGATDAEAAKLLLDDTVLPPGLTAEEEREACRALKGAMLRQEVYGLDGTDKQPHPYAVTEQNFAVRLLQPRATNPHAVFFSHQREVIEYHYERRPSDPRVTHALTLEVDDFGNELQSASVAYGRRQADPALEPRDQARQAAAQIAYVESTFTNDVQSADAHRTPLPSESRSYELTGLLPSPGSHRFTPPQLLGAASGGTEIPYEAVPTPGVLQKRLIERVRTLYRSDDLTGPLPPGTSQSLALPFEDYRLAFTPGLLGDIYGGRVTPTILGDEGRYMDLDGDLHRWISSGRTFHSPDGADAAPAELAYARAHFFVPRRYRDPFGNTTLVAFDSYDLLMTETRDALDNRTSVGERDASGDVLAGGHDYRVLQPRLLTDPNGNRTAASFDALGMVVGTAVMGKRDESPRQGDLLDGFVPDLTDDVVAAHLADPLGDPQAILSRATTRLVYDLFAYHRTKGQPQPAPTVVYTLVRETHDAELAAGGETKTQQAFSYSDGLGREIQQKARGGKLTDVEPRWVGSGWTVFDNKGNPVRQFEPFFTTTHRFEADVRIGVSPILCHDPVGRVVAIVHPNHAWEKVRFDSWRQESWDVNDTSLVADPRTDPDVAAFFQRLPDADYLPTWHAQRAGGDLGAEEQDAAAKTVMHAATPSVAHVDALGRTFLTIAHNRFKRRDAPPAESPTEELYATRVILDIEGNQRAVVDALDRVAVRYDYDLLGNRVHQASLEAGERWTLGDAAGRPIRTWDSHGHVIRTEWDALHRPSRTFVTGADEQSPAAELLIARTEYGEGVPDDVPLNLRGKAFRQFDTAGVASNLRFDFKGNLLQSSRQLAQAYKTIPDWSASPALEAQAFTSATTYDALNRPTIMTAPDGSVFHPGYDAANRLDSVAVQLQGAPGATPFVTRIDYDAKGQRQRIDYGNGVATSYAYDPLTFRLTRMRTLRAGDQALLQDLSYAYDPVGNITHLHDGGQQDRYFSNQVVTPDNDYRFDAVYRLIQAQGREHIGQSAQPQTTWNDEFRVNLPHPGDGPAMRGYQEDYGYDPVGNILHLIHQAAGGNWTRDYTYDEASLLEPARKSNRLSATTAAGTAAETYAYDAHGNTTSMAHLPSMRWDFRDQLVASSRQVVGGGVAETTYYVYDGAGQRARKVTERANGTRRHERLYLGGFELYREYDGGGVVATLERQTLHVLDDQRLIALVETRVPGGNGPAEPLVRYQFGNHLGSASLELDADAAIISYEEYFPYGSTSYQAVRSGLEAAPKRYRFTAMERDEETGLECHGARYYAPWLGRWTSTDPAGFVDGPNLYRYVSDNPVKASDPSGMGPQDSMIYAQERRDANKINPTLPKIQARFKAIYEEKMAAKIIEAHAKFRLRHADHTIDVLDNIDAALETIAKDNPGLILAYYNFYSDEKLTDDLDRDEALGDTDSSWRRGGFYTDLNVGVLQLERLEGKPTKDPRLLLASTLLHEFVHGPQAKRGDDPQLGNDEAKAYGIENFFNLRLGDKERAAVSESKGLKYGQATFNTSSEVMGMLYDVIDKGASSKKSLKGVTAAQARGLAIEFITKNAEDFGEQLKTIIDTEYKDDAYGRGFKSLP